MLIQCPECELQVSDKALACPHCGYPLKPNSEKSPPGKSKNRKYQRLPNGFGQITELKNRNLRNKFRVMISEGKTEYGRPIQKLLRPRAYFPSYKEAYEALLEYHKNPYDLDRNITVEELYKKWFESYSEHAKTQDSLNNYTNAWNYCSELASMPVSMLRPRHIKHCIENGVRVKDGEEYPVPLTIKPMIKIMFNLMLDYAVEYEIVDKNYARSFELSSEVNENIKENSKGHIAFTDDELSTLWTNLDKISGIDAILIQCYMGWRPQELCLLKISDVNLDKNYIIGGIKTQSGKGRIVPIHPCIRPLIEEKIKCAVENKSETLIMLETRIGRGQKTVLKPVTYHWYRERFHSIMDELGLNPEHRPHDPRKTFVTMGKKSGLNEYAIKRIVGHTVHDITEAVYTERDPEWLYEEVCKIPSR